MNLPQYRKKDMESVEYGRRKQSVTTDPDIEGTYYSPVNHFSCVSTISQERPTISSFFEAVGRVTVRSEDRYFVAQFLQPNCSINDKPLCSPFQRLLLHEQHKT